MVRQIYIFSGLGADERVFQKLDFSGYSVTYIKWVTPYERETIEGYTHRILRQITSAKPTLIGLSFGGMIAIEVAKMIETEKVIVIASAKVKDEIPLSFRRTGQLGFHKMFPTTLLTNPNRLSNWLFGAESTYDKEVLKEVLRATDPVFLKWALTCIACWTNEEKLHNVFHIHGSKDRILPMKHVQCDAIIEGGGHSMTLNRSQQLNEILRNQLADRPPS